RFDMSEFMDAGAAQRLIQGTDRAEGMLTRQVRRQPFGVLLLDEIEKADRAVFDLLLQVCGEGRLTDARGKTAYFHNTIIIMTSNLGAAQHRPRIGLTDSASDDMQSYYVDQVNATFRPEFVNRLDRIIAFHKLTQAQVAQVAEVMLRKVKGRQGLAEAGIQLRLSDAAVAHLAEGGYSEAYGARALRRHIDDTLVAPLSAVVGAHAHQLRHATIMVECDGEAWQPEGMSMSRKRVLASWSRGGLTGTALQGRATQQRQELFGMAGLATMRRDVDGWLRLGAADEVRDRLEAILAQLNYGSGKRKNRARRKSASSHDPRVSAQIAELQAEHHRLNTLWSQATELRRDLCDLEELGMAALFDEEALGPFVEEAKTHYRTFQHHLIKLLLALQPQRDAITLLVQEPEPCRSMDRWVLPLLDLLSERSWSLKAHGYGVTPREDETWPYPHWGPERSAHWLKDQLTREERPFRQVLLRIKGPWAGVMLAFEAGTHRWSGLGGDHDPCHMIVQCVALRTQLTRLEWSKHLEPPAFPPAQALSSSDPVRHTLCNARRGRAGDRLAFVGRSLDLDAPSAAAYWAHIDDIVFEHVMHLEQTHASVEPLLIGFLDRLKEQSADS
ncbi:MAG: AAA family ATPase, partial [Myxococcota bacterium]